MQQLGISHDTFPHLRLEVNIEGSFQQQHRTTGRLCDEVKYRMMYLVETHLRNQIHSKRELPFTSGNGTSTFCGFLLFSC